MSLTRLTAMLIGVEINPYPSNIMIFS